MMGEGQLSCPHKSCQLLTRCRQIGRIREDGDEPGFVGRCCCQRFRGTGQQSRRSGQDSHLTQTKGWTGMRATSALQMNEDCASHRAKINRVSWWKYRILVCQASRWSIICQTTLATTASSYSCSSAYGRCVGRANQGSCKGISGPIPAQLDSTYKTANLPILHLFSRPVY